MLRWSIGFLVLALVAGLVGFTGVAGVATLAAKWLFIGFLVLAVITLLSGRRVNLNG